jgi:hypothetical protein
MFDWIRTHPWAYPTLEAVHVLGIAALIGTLLLVELRVWGWGRSLSLPALARLALPVSLGGFVLVALSGALMAASQWQELWANPIFRIKLGLIVLAGVNAGVFHARGALLNPDAWARAQTVVSLLVWALVVFCGRFIAYV